MSNRRHLVSRARRDENATPASRSHQRDSDIEGSIALPPYQPPACALSVAAKAKIEALQLAANHDYSKYERHIKASALSISGTIGEANEALVRRKALVARAAAKRREKDIEDTDEDRKITADAKNLEKQVIDLTSKAEKAMRDLIDYEDEVPMQKLFLREVLDKATVAGEGQAPAEDPEIQSAIEILQTAKEKYSNDWTKRTKRARYAENNSYKNFKRVLHDAQNSEIENPPPLAHARTWFPDENEDGSSRRRTNNTTDNTNNEDEEDNDIVVVKGKEILRCPITLQYMNEPYSSNVCNHSYEKNAIWALHQSAGRPPVLTCPVPGCGKSFRLSELYFDQALKRRIIQAQAREKREADGEEDDEDNAAPRGTQMSRPEEIDENEDDDGIDIDEMDVRRRDIAKIKRERARSRGLSLAPSQTNGGSQIEEDDSMDID